ncbi:MAG TPA: DoxX family protein [Candidatus Paceibacterota bacterium]|nr:DoxX family protein [Candidatus Paceibacterota bacterium]
MIGKMMKKCSWGNVDMGLLAIRIGVASVFIFMGWMKVSNLDATVMGFGQMGFAPFWAYLVAFTELIGGVAVLLGVYTRFFATLLAIVMLVATITVHKDKTLSLHIFTLIGLVLSGGGKYSIVKSACGCGKCAICQESDVEPKAPQNPSVQM